MVRVVIIKLKMLSKLLQRQVIDILLCFYFFAICSCLLHATQLNVFILRLYFEFFVIYTLLFGVDN
jgi:hypothetical protein